MSWPRARHCADVGRRNPGDNEQMTCLRFPARAPIAADDAASGNTELVSHGPDRPIRLLVADDDARVRAAIGQTISLEAGLVVVAAAADAAAALASAERTGPSVALVDVLIPDQLTGLALVRSLAQRSRCAVVAMSVRGGLRQAALAAGAVAFAEKDDIDAILDAVRAAAPPHCA
jgi:two-component system response regulator DesR